MLILFRLRFLFLFYPLLQIPYQCYCWVCPQEYKVHFKRNASFFTSVTFLHVLYFCLVKLILEYRVTVGIYTWPAIRSALKKFKIYLFFYLCYVNVNPCFDYLLLNGTLDTRLPSLGHTTFLVTQLETLHFFYSYPSHLLWVKPISI